MDTLNGDTIGWKVCTLLVCIPTSRDKSPQRFKPTSRDKTMADKLMYIPNMLHKIIPSVNKN